MAPNCGHLVKNLAGQRGAAGGGEGGGAVEEEEEGNAECRGGKDWNDKRGRVAASGGEELQVVCPGCSFHAWAAAAELDGPVFPMR